MTLTVDADKITNDINDLSERFLLDADVLQRLEDDLDIDDKVSILFLMVDNYSSAFPEVFDLFRKGRTQGIPVLSQFVIAHPRGWKEKLLEALCVIQNRRVVRKLGLSFDDLKVIYLPGVAHCARHVNAVAKGLYMLCEALSEDRTESLVRSVNSDSIEENSGLNGVGCLELHLLYWMSINYISIRMDGKVDLKNLLKHIKPFDELELIYTDLKRFDDNQNVLDTSNASVTSVIQSLPAIGRKESVNESTAGTGKEEDVKRIRNGFCLIISQIIFSGEYETRDSSKVDANNLRDTFEGFGFEVVVLENLDEHEMLETLASIPQRFGTAYECLFVCLLSHGSEGSVITRDDKKVTLKTIERKICCAELEDVIKIVVVQACQGKMTGEAADDLTADGPTTDANNSTGIKKYKNFCMFVSTMQGFVSVRHKIQGSWFIQEFCRILRCGQELTFLQAYRRITQSVEKRRGKLHGVDPVAQIPELLYCRLMTDFQFPPYKPRRSPMDPRG